MTTKQADVSELPVWDLSDLYRSPNDNEIESDIERLEQLALALHNEWRGSIATLPAEQLACVMQQFEIILELRKRLYSYAHLLWASDTKNPTYGALLQRIRETGSSVIQQVLFIQLEWAALSDQKAEILNEKPLQQFRYWLESSREFGKHYLSEEEERIIISKDLTGRTAWVRFYEEFAGSLRIPLDGEDLSVEDVYRQLRSPRRESRRAAITALAPELERHAHTFTFVFNTVLADCALNDDLRSYRTWLSARNLNNAISDDSVQTLLTTTREHYRLVSRYYNLKRRLLGLDTMHEWDRGAPLPLQEESLSWYKARALIENAYSDFHPEMGRIAALFFRKNWIHAAPTPGKRSGGFCASVVPSVHPYILLNFNGSPRSVRTLAHELGHGIHQYLSRDKGILHFQAPLTLAETASVFGEMLVYRKMLDQEIDDEKRLALMLQKVESSISIVFNQVAFSTFEEAIHTARRNQGELSTEQITELWMESQHSLYGNAVELSENYKRFWCIVGHFVRSPGYVYAYAFGELMVLSLFNTYLEEGPDFAERYVRFLAAGGSDSPERLLATLGIDLRDPAFWELGIRAIESMLLQAEELMKRIRDVPER